MALDGVQIEGARDLTALFTDLGNAKQLSIFRQAVNFASSPILREARRTVPRGPTGNLAAAVRKSRVKTAKDKTFVHSNVFNRAPHILLVEFGTTTRRVPKGDKRLRIPAGKLKTRIAARRGAGGKFVKGQRRALFLRSVGKMPASHFMIRALDKHRQAIPQRFHTKFIKALLAKFKVRGPK